jgi:hypothetical protein
MPIPNAFVAQTTRTVPAANASCTRERSVSGSPAWYVAAGMAAAHSVPAAASAPRRVAA